MIFEFIHVSSSWFGHLGHDV